MGLGERYEYIAVEDIKIPSVDEVQENLASIYNFLNKNYPEFLRHVKNKPGSRLGEKLYIYYFGSATCPVCGKKPKFLSFTRGYSTYCSSKCRANDPEIQRRTEETNRERYGVDRPLQNQEILKKMEETNLKKYGTKSSAQNENVKEKQKQTNLKRYGTVAPTQNEEVLKKVRSSTLESLGVEHPLQSPEVLTKMVNTTRNNYIINNSIGVIGYAENGDWIVRCPHPECNRCREKTFVISSRIYIDRTRLGIEPCIKLLPFSPSISSGENELVEYVRSLGIECIQSWNGLRGQQIDCYIPSLQLGVEFNGVYWHSLDQKTPDYERSSYGRSSKAPDYHFKKWKAAKELGIRLITIWDFQWDNDQDNVKEFIRRVLEGDRDAKYGNRLDGCSYNEWISIDPDDVILEKQSYNDIVYIDSGRYEKTND